MDIVQAIEIFATITGVAYVVLEILQKNAMWVVGVLTGMACAYSFALQHLWASMGLNIYYVVISFVGFYQWRKDSATLSHGNVSSTIHLRHLTLGTLLRSAAILVVASALLALLLQRLGDGESSLDAVVCVASAIGTWWLAKSYPSQWLVWVAADILSTALCARTGLWWMSGMYLVYCLSAIYGYVHWMKKGVWVD